MGRPEGRGFSMFGNKEFIEHLERYAEISRRRIAETNEEADWISERFVPIEAEVEVRSSNQRFRQKSDLLTAIADDQQTRTFLIIGEPGSGKSVALRKLWEDLHDEIIEAQRIPLYINLREWSTKEPWSRSNPPTTKDLNSFVYTKWKTLIEDDYADDILTRYREMVQKGHIFFLFDSFDEIPAVLDAGNNQWIIDELSKVIYNFLDGAHKSRGVVASRPYRRPSSIKFTAQKTLEIRPFSERKIQAAFRLSQVPGEVITHIFAKRKDLLQLSQNPFYLSLIVNYILNNANSLPEKRIHLYQSYISERLRSRHNDFEDVRDFDPGKVEQLCGKIAKLMFDNEDYGFELPVSEIKKKLSPSTSRIDKILNILKVSGIGRLSGKTNSSFSFSHRRFAEYFFVTSLSGQEANLPLDGIPNDSKWREVLVLYAELANDEKAVEIAVFCWIQIQSIGLKERNKHLLPVIHCQRFLRDAFRFREEALSLIEYSLADFVMSEILYSQNLLRKKFALEITGLLEQSTGCNLIEAAFSQNNQWLTETAIRSCLHLNSLGKDMEWSIILYLDGLSFKEFISKFLDFSFIFRLTPIFGNIRVFLYTRMIDIGLLLAGFVLLVVHKPLTALAFVFLMELLPSIWNIYSDEKNDSFRTSRGEQIKRVAAKRMIFPAILIISFVSVWVTEVLFLQEGYTIPKFGFEIPFSNWFILLFFPWYQAYYYLFKFNLFVGRLKIEEYREFFDELRKGPGILKKIQTFFLGFKHFNYRRAVKSIFLTGVEMGELLRPRFPSLRRLLSAAGFLPLLGLMFGGDPYNTYSLIILFIVICTLVLTPPIKLIINKARDFRLNRSFFENTIMDRQMISKQFYNLKMESSRRQFVRSLELTGIRPTGEWPDNILPNVKGQKASEELARLEERWLNLDR